MFDHTTIGYLCYNFCELNITIDFNRIADSIYETVHFVLGLTNSTIEQKGKNDIIFGLSCIFEKILDDYTKYIVDYPDLFKKIPKEMMELTIITNNEVNKDYINFGVKITDVFDTSSSFNIRSFYC